MKIKFIEMPFICEITSIWTQFIRSKSTIALMFVILAKAIHNSVMIGCDPIVLNYLNRHNYIYFLGRSLAWELLPMVSPNVASNHSPEERMSYGRPLTDHYFSCSGWHTLRWDERNGAEASTAGETTNILTLSENLGLCSLALPLGSADRYSDTSEPLWDSPHKYLILLCVAMSSIAVDCNPTLSIKFMPFWGISHLMSTHIHSKQFSVNAFHLHSLSFSLKSVIQK